MPLNKAVIITDILATHSLIHQQIYFILRNHTTHLNNYITRKFIFNWFINLMFYFT